MAAPPAPPYRIAYVIGELGKGGAEYQLHALLRRLDRASFVPHVFVLTPGGWWADPIRALGVPVTELPRRSSADVSRLIMLRRAIRAFAPHVLHTVLWSANCYGRAAALGLGIPVRVAAERNVIRRPLWQVAVERILDRATDCYLVNCQAVADMLTGRERLPREKVRVVPNGIDLSRLPPFALDRRPARAAMGFDPKRRLVAQVGRLVPQKDHRTFLIAAAAMAPRVPDVDFLLVGSGDERSALQAEARRLGLGSRLCFTGERDDVPTLLGAVDVLTSTSLYEGFPNVVVEAMAAGAVPVVTDVGGCRELVVPDETGFLVPPRAPDAVANTALRVLADPSGVQRLALAGRRRVEGEFTVEAMAERTVAAYQALLHGGRVKSTAVAAA